MNDYLLKRMLRPVACSIVERVRVVEAPGALVVRPQDWEAQGDEFRAEASRWPSGLAWRGMTSKEYDATVGAGKPVQSTGAYSHESEGTNFAESPLDAESYVGYGRDDPRKTGKPTYLIGVERTTDMQMAPDGYLKTQEPVPLENVKFILKMNAEDGAVVGQVLKEAKGIPNVQWHGTKRELLDGILRNGLQVQRPRFAGEGPPALYTASEFKYAAMYAGTDGVVFELAVDPRAKYVTKDPQRHMRKGENLLDAADRWLLDVAAKGLTGFVVPGGWQSSAGNHTIDPSVFTVVGVYDVRGNRLSEYDTQLAGSVTESTIPDPPQYMVDFYTKRMDEHVARVFDNILRLVMASVFKGDVEELILRGTEHDASKYEDPERTPYIWLTWWYREKDQGREFEYPEGVKELVDQATGHHVKTNAHHPEFHGDPQKMSDVDLAEMVCDWAAMSQEKGTSLQEWFENCQGDKTELINPKNRDGKRSYKWTDDQVKTIQSYVDYFDPDGEGVEDTLEKVDESTQTDPLRAVEQYLKVTPDVKSYQVFSASEWDEMFPPDVSDNILGGVAAVTTPSREVYAKEGYEDSLVHELLHAAGFMPLQVGDFLNEGVTQLVAEDICGRFGIEARPTYKDEVHFVRRYVLPLTGLSLQEFARGYATASNKGQYVGDLIWGQHGDKFTEEDWGRDPKGQFIKDLSYTVGTVPHLTFLVDEKRVEESALPPGTWYHGSPHKFDQFNVVNRNAFGTGASEVPVFLTPKRSFAKLHAGGNGYIYTVRPRVTKVFATEDFISPDATFPPSWDDLTPLGQRLAQDIEDGKVFKDVASLSDDERYEEVYAYGGYLHQIARGSYDIMETTEMKAWFREQGFDAFMVSGDGEWNLAVFDSGDLEILSVEPVGLDESVSPKRLALLRKKFPTAKEFNQARLSGFGAVDVSAVLGHIDKTSNTRLDTPAIRLALQDAGTWFFLHEVPLSRLQDVDVPSSSGGLQIPIVVGESGEIIDGRHRVAAAREQGLKVLPAYIPANLFYELELQGLKESTQTPRILTDADGFPLALYQGNDTAGINRNPQGGAEYGIYLTAKRGYATRYGTNVHKTWVQLANPLYVRDKSEISPRDFTKEDAGRLIGQGYDGIISGNRDKPDEVILFDSSSLVQFEDWDEFHSLKNAGLEESSRVMTADELKGRGEEAWVEGFFSRYPSLQQFQNVPVYYPDEDEGPEATQRVMSGKHAVVLYPKFWVYDGKTKDYILIHEFGHYVSSVVGFGVLMDYAEKAGIDPWDTPNLPFGEHNSEEAFAESFAVYHLNPEELNKRYPKWATLVIWMVTKFEMVGGVVEAHCHPAEGSRQMTRDELLRRGQAVDGFMNCKLFIQTVTGVSALDSLPARSYVGVEDLQMGDILRWRRSHYSIYVGNGDVMEVEEWGAPVQVMPLQRNLDELDVPDAVYSWPRETVVEAKDPNRSLTPEEGRLVAKANVWATDVWCDDGCLPERIDYLSGLDKMSPVEARELIKWFEETAPGSFS